MAEEFAFVHDVTREVYEADLRILDWLAATAVCLFKGGA
jgi:hypothetical protein